MAMIIASYNCNSVRTRLPIIERWIKDNSPDILCLQETKATDSDFPLSDIENWGYKAAFRGEKSYNGVAILYKGEVSDVRFGFDEEPGDETRLIWCSYKGFTIVNTYIPQGRAVDSEMFQYKLNWFRRLYELFDKRSRPDKPLIWCGDFNVAYLPIDVHNPKRLLGSVGYHPDEHKALAYAKDWGFEDVFRHFNPEGGEYTFWDYRVKDAVERGLGWRVDHIFATRSAMKGAKRSWIDREPRNWERPSDHTFICAEFEV